MKKLSIILALALAFIGCGVGQDVLDAIKTTNEAVALGEPFVEAAYRAQLQACTAGAKSEPEGLACMDRVDAAWKPYADVLAKVREIRCKLEPAKCAAPAPSDTTTVTVTKEPTP